MKKDKMEIWNERLLTAAHGGKIEALTVCLDNEADINYQDNLGWTALMFAARRGHTKCTQLLLDIGCLKEITDNCGWTAIIFAVSQGHLEIIRLLIERGCNKNIKSNDGRTALHFAAQYGYLHVVRYLVEEAGISPLIKTRKRNTPYDLAEQHQRHSGIMEYLQVQMNLQSDVRTCSICADRESDSIIWPCVHAICYVCGVHLMINDEACPICRGAIEQVQMTLQSDVMTCSTCADRESDAIIWPCIHAICYVCGVHLMINNEPCPICRGVIEQVRTIYYT